MSAFRKKSGRKHWRVSVVGATGYTGGELIRLLIRHPQVTIAAVTSESIAGESITQAHPWLTGRWDMRCEKYNADSIALKSDIVFLCLPHGSAMVPAAELVNRGKRVIDLSADFRLNDPELYQQWYALSHSEPQLIKKAVYGIPELYRQKIKHAQLIANPGCYATAIILALAPIIAHKKADPHSLIVDAKSGVSGAGKKLKLMYHYPEVNENLLAYSVASHRHLPEIEQELAKLCSETVRLTFTPHLVPITRGIFATCYARLLKSSSLDDIITLYRTFYRHEPFVAVLPHGVYPELKNVSYTNFCHIGIALDERNHRVVILSAIDNLVKGASGQAVQNMNIMCGLNETDGL